MKVIVKEKFKNVKCRECSKQARNGIDTFYFIWFRNRSNLIKSSRVFYIPLCKNCFMALKSKLNEL